MAVVHKTLKRNFENFADETVPKKNLNTTDKHVVCGECISNFWKRNRKSKPENDYSRGSGKELVDTDNRYSD